MRVTPGSLRRNVVVWLRQGISPRRLALTLALGFAIGCIPVVGVPTLTCAALALLLRLNLPAIQAANYVMTPLQLLLIVPFARLGEWLFDRGHDTPSPPPICCGWRRWLWRRAAPASPFMPFWHGWLWPAQRSSS
jgi:uncharacterized protein (DUF2062 family)